MKMEKEKWVFSIQPQYAVLGKAKAQLVLVQSIPFLYPFPSLPPRLSQTVVCEAWKHKIISILISEASGADAMGTDDDTL